ncbi:MAG: hypothetical protein HRT56_03150 [Coraliomargarita sp.]|nr:hypothetical protein [Coraliomargarita sp.]
MKQTSKIKTQLLTILFIIVGAPTFAIVTGEKPLTVRITQDQSKGTVFDIINLIDHQSAQSAAGWIYTLNTDSQGKDPHYSNSVYLEFIGPFEKEVVQWICDSFEMSKVYVLGVTIETNGKKEFFEHELDFENMIQLLDLPKSQKQNLLDAHSDEVAPHH